MSTFSYLVAIAAAPSRVLYDPAGSHTKETLMQSIGFNELTSLFPLQRLAEYTDTEFCELLSYVGYVWFLFAILVPPSRPG